MGVTIFDLLYGFSPFVKATDECKYWFTIKNKRWTSYWNYVNRYKNINDELFQELFEKMMEENPDHRCDIEYVLKHPWLNGDHDLSQLE